MIEEELEGQVVCHVVGGNDFFRVLSRSAELLGPRDDYTIVEAGVK